MSYSPLIEVHEDGTIKRSSETGAEIILDKGEDLQNLTSPDVRRRLFYKDGEDAQFRIFLKDKKGKIFRIGSIFPNKKLINGEVAGIFLFKKIDKNEDLRALSSLLRDVQNSFLDDGHFRIDNPGNDCGLHIAQADGDDDYKVYSRSELQQTFGGSLFLKPVSLHKYENLSRNNNGVKYDLNNCSFQKELILRMAGKTTIDANNFIDMNNVKLKNDLQNDKIKIVNFISSHSNGGETPDYFPQMSHLGNKNLFIEINYEMTKPKANSLVSSLNGELVEGINIHTFTDFSARNQANLVKGMIESGLNVKRANITIAGNKTIRIYENKKYTQPTKSPQPKEKFEKSLTLNI